MRVETNMRLVERNKRIAHFLFFFSMAVLIGGFIVANTQLTSQTNNNMAIALFLPWLVLPIGFICTIVSVRMTNLWIRRPRPEEAIREGLKGLSKKSSLYNYYHFPARHVLITPQGVYAIVSRFQEGNFVVEGDKWRTKSGFFGILMRFFRRDDIGNPNADALRAAAHVKKLLAPIAANIEVQPLIVFVDPRANVEITNPTIPVLYTDIKKSPNLKDYMRDAAHQQEKPEANDAVKKKGGSKAKPTDKSANGVLEFDPEELAEAFEEATLPAYA
jgi:hypothetical protein